MTENPFEPTVADSSRPELPPHRPGFRFRVLPAAIIGIPAAIVFAISGMFLLRQLYFGFRSHFQILLNDPTTQALSVRYFIAFAASVFASYGAIAIWRGQFSRGGILAVASPAVAWFAYSLLRPL